MSFVNIYDIEHIEFHQLHQRFVWMAQAETNSADKVAMLAMRQSLSFPSSNWATSDDPCGLPSKN
jgi:hypothetical protein